MRPRLRSCLSTPLVSDQRLVGVLTLYSTQQKAFTEDHRRVIEAVAAQVAENVRHALTAADGALTDALVGLPNRQQLQRFVNAELAEGRGRAPFSLILVSLGPSLRPDGSHDRSVRIVEAIRRVLKDGDILFRYGRRELVILLAGTDDSAAATMVGTMTASVSEGAMSTQISRMNFSPSHLALPPLR